MKIAVVSDRHLLVPDLDSHSLFPQQLESLPREKAEELYTHTRELNARASDVALEWIQQHGPWDMVIDLGDMTGGWQERGCSDLHVAPLAHTAVNELQRLAPTSRVCWGNHDMGYTHRGALPDSGISIDSVDWCGELAPYWWVKENDQTLLIGVSSPLASYHGNCPELIRLRNRQQQFVGDELNARRDKLWMLFAHDPATTHFLLPQVEYHLNRLSGFVFGDLHSKWAGRLAILKGHIRSYLPGKGQVAAQVLRRGIFCPSTAPLWWKGFHLLTLEVTAKGVTHQQIDLTRSPFSHPVRCAWWMVKPK